MSLLVGSGDRVVEGLVGGVETNSANTEGKREESPHVAGSGGLASSRRGDLADWRQGARIEKTGEKEGERDLGLPAGLETAAARATTGEERKKERKKERKREKVKKR